MKVTDICMVISIVNRLYKENDFDTFHSAFMVHKSRYLHRCLGRFGDGKILSDISLCGSCKLRELCGYMFSYFWYHSRGNMLMSIFYYSLIGEVLKKLQEEYNIH